MTTVPPLPTPLRIGPYDVDVEDYAQRLASSENRWGAFNRETLIIKICTEDVSKWIVLDTFIHEILHAVWWANNIQNKDEEERTVMIMATGLTQVFRDNPRLREWISQVCEPVDHDLIDRQTLLPR